MDYHCLAEDSQRLADLKSGFWAAATHSYPINSQFKQRIWGEKSLVGLSFYMVTLYCKLTVKFALKLVSFGSYSALRSEVGC